MRRLGQTLALLVTATCAVGAGAFIALALYYHRFATEVRTAEASVPASVGAVLSPTAGALDQSQVTLVRASGTPAAGGVVLLRTAPQGETTAFLSIPRSAVLAGEPVSRVGTAGLVRELRTTLGIGVSHVATINLASASTDGERRDQGEQQVLGAIADQALAPTSFTQFQAAGRAIAHTATDLTPADLVGLVWTRLDDHQVVRCAFVEHQTIDSVQGQAIAAAFRGREGAGRVSSCRARAVAPAAVVPPRAVVAMVQQFGTWAFVLSAAGAMLISLGMAALFARIRSGAETAAPMPPIDPVGLGPTLAVSLSRVVPAAPRLGRVNQPAAAALAGAVRGARAGATATVQASMASLGRRARPLAAYGRVGLRRVTEIRECVSERHGHGRRRAVALIGAASSARAGRRSRVRRFVYLHQDAIWIGLCTGVATGILIRLLWS
ncbi:MAG TPA: hypothetical protein VLB81_16595 [Gaiellales bacterium]|nr:hypothetical protein [Gaiellales bacterium]